MGSLHVTFRNVPPGSFPFPPSPPTLLHKRSVWVWRRDLGSARVPPRPVRRSSETREFTPVTPNPSPPSVVAPSPPDRAPPTDPCLCCRSVPWDREATTSVSCCPVRRVHRRLRVPQLGGTERRDPVGATHASPAWCHPVGATPTSPQRSFWRLALASGVLPPALGGRGSNPTPPTQPPAPIPSAGCSGTGG